MKMNKILMILMVLILMTCSVNAVRTLDGYGIVPEDTSSYINDSYINFGSNIAQGNLVNTRCTMTGNSILGVLIDEMNGNVGDKKEIISYGASNVYYYHDNCAYVNSSLVGTVYGTGVITNIDNDAYKEVTLPIFNATSGTVFVKTYEIVGSQIILIKSINTGESAKSGVNCYSDGTNTYCMTNTGAINNKQVKRLNMTSNTVTAFTSGVSCIEAMSQVKLFNVSYTADYNANSGTPDDVIYFISHIDGSGRIKVSTNVWNIKSGAVIFDNDCGAILDTHATSQPLVTSATPIQIGAYNSLLEIAISTNDLETTSVSYSTFKFFDNSGSEIYSLQTTYNNGLGDTSKILGSNIVSADVNNDGFNEFIFMDNLGYLHNIAWDYHEISSFLMPSYCHASSNQLLYLTIGEVNSSSYGKELISDCGIFAINTNTTTKLSQLFGITAISSISSTEQGIYNLVDVDSDGADELYYSKINANNHYMYDMTPTVAPPSLTITDTTPIYCSFDLDTINYPPARCVKRHIIANCLNASLCSVGVDNTYFNSSPNSVRLISSSGDEVQIWNNTIGNTTTTLTLQFDKYLPNVNPSNTEMNVAIYSTNVNSTNPQIMDAFRILHNGTIIDGDGTKQCSVGLGYYNWIHVRYYLDMVTRQSTIFYNNTQCGAVHTFSDYPPYNYAQAFAIGVYNGFSVAIDNVRVNKTVIVPPTTTTIPATTTTSLYNTQVCGNSVCQSAESHASCPTDCLIITCGDGICDTGETRITCPMDCSEAGLNFLVAPDDSSRGLLPELATGLTSIVIGTSKLLPVFLVLGIMGMIVLIGVAVTKIIK